MGDTGINLPLEAPDAELVRRCLALEVGILSARLAEVLQAAGSEGALESARAFLHGHFESAADGRQLSDFQGGPQERRPDGPTHPLDRLMDLLQPSREEAELMLLAALAEQHEGLAAVLRTLHPRSESRISVALAARLLFPSAEKRVRLRDLLVSSPIITQGAVEVVGDGPLFERSLQLADSLWAALHGIDSWPSSVVIARAPIVLNGLSEWLESDAAAQAIAAIRGGKPCTVLLTADRAETALFRALALVQHAGARSVAISVPDSPTPEWERLVRIHALAQGIVPVLNLSETEGPKGGTAPGFGAYPVPVVVCSRAGTTRMRAEARPLVRVPIGPLASTTRRRMWAETIPSLADHAPYLAARYPVEPAVAAEVAADLDCLQELVGRAPTVEDVHRAIRARSGLTLASGVKLIRPGAGWEQLVLPKDRKSQLSEAVNRLNLQAVVLDEWGFLKDRPGARGVRMLFAGPPGTGKTLSAEVIAKSLSVDLLAVDISRVVSKWIGETEKNLAAVFDTAERAQAVLFFDEADALFGKRTEVSDAHDRYANLETAYLLARLERFEGMAVLATNLRENIDPAFLRRIEFVVDFEDPDREQRFQLWQRHIPDTELLDPDVNLFELATLYPVVGGFIRNAAVAAGFLAAEDQSKISRNHFVHAIRREYQKSGRAFPGAPLGVTLH